MTAEQNLKPGKPRKRREQNDRAIRGILGTLNRTGFVANVYTLQVETKALTVSLNVYN